MGKPLREGCVIQERGTATPLRTALPACAGMRGAGWRSRCSHPLGTSTKHSAAESVETEALQWPALFRKSVLQLKPHPGCPEVTGISVLEVIGLLFCVSIWMVRETKVTNA